MSPACVATIFEGDNGGATSRGVSSTEIRVALTGTWSDAARKTTVDALFDYVNQRFELYGRRLVPVPVAGSASDPVAARAMVADAASQNVFAAVTGLTEQGNPHAALPVELARQHVVEIARGAAAAWSEHIVYDSWHPYIWSVFPSAEDVQANLGDFACAALAGDPARFAGDAGLREKTRRFGVVSAAEVTPPSPSTLVRALDACTGQRPSVVEAVGIDAMRPAFERLRADGVTTVFCVCDDDYAYFAYSYGGDIFHPEWITLPDTARSNCANECTIQEFRRSGKVAPPIRIDPGPRVLPMQARPWFGPLSAAMSATPGSTATFLGFAELIYPSLLVLAAGIQGAGPQLTPDTFAQGLMASPFPNPGAGAPPYWQPSAGFGPGDHSFYDDYSIAWWSDDAEALETPQNAQPRGSWCYVDQAARFQVGRYTSAIKAKLFNPELPCR